MTRLAYLLLPVMAVCAVACTSGDDSPDLPPGGGDTVDGHECLWRVESMVCRGDSGYYSYDGSGRLVRYVRHYDSGHYGADTISYVYDSEAGRIFTTYCYHHHYYSDYPEDGSFRITTDTLFLRAGVVDSCAGVMRYGSLPEQKHLSERPFTMRFTYDAEGRLLHHVTRQAGFPDFHYSYEWDGDNLVGCSYREYGDTVTYAFAYGAQPNPEPAGFPLNSTLLLPQHYWLYSYGLFGRQCRSLKDTVSMEDKWGSRSEYGYSYQYDADGLIDRVWMEGDGQTQEYKVTYIKLRD